MEARPAGQRRCTRQGKDATRHTSEEAACCPVSVCCWGRNRRDAMLRPCAAAGGQPRYVCTFSHPDSQQCAREYQTFSKLLWAQSPPTRRKADSLSSSAQLPRHRVCHCSNTTTFTRHQHHHPLPRIPLPRATETFKVIYVCL